MIHFICVYQLSLCFVHLNIFEHNVELFKGDKVFYSDADNMFTLAFVV